MKLKSNERAILKSINEKYEYLTINTVNNNKFVSDKKVLVDKGKIQIQSDTCMYRIDLLFRDDLFDFPVGCYEIRRLLRD